MRHGLNHLFLLVCHCIIPPTHCTIILSPAQLHPSHSPILYTLSPAQLHPSHPPLLHPPQKNKHHHSSNSTPDSPQTINMKLSLSILHLMSPHSTCLPPHTLPPSHPLKLHPFHLSVSQPMTPQWTVLVFQKIPPNCTPFTHIKPQVSTTYQ